MKKIAMFLAMATLLVFPLAGCGGKKTLKWRLWSLPTIR